MQQILSFSPSIINIANLCAQEVNLGTHFFSEIFLVLDIYQRNLISLNVGIAGGRRRFAKLLQAMSNYLEMYGYELSL